MDEFKGWLWRWVKNEGKAKQNKEDKIEVNDADIVYIQNGVGGYCSMRM